MVDSFDSEMDTSIESDSARVGSVEEKFISEEGKKTQIGVLVYTNDNTNSNNNMYLMSTLN